MPRNYHRSLRSLSKWHSPVILVHVLRYFQNLFCKRNWNPYHLQRPIFPTPGSTSSRSSSPMPTFTFCFTFLHVLFERCNYFNNGCVLFSIGFLSFLLLIFFLFVNRVSLTPGFCASGERGTRPGGGGPRLAVPPPPPLWDSPPSFRASPF